MDDFDTMRFGCNAKLPAKQLIEITKKESVKDLCQDSSHLSIDHNTYATVDSVFSCSRDPKVYSEAAFYHCVNDLIASKVKPTDCLISYGFEVGSSSSVRKSIIETIEKTAKDNNINIVNRHTYLPDKMCLTFTFIGVLAGEKNFEVFEEGLIYDIIITKPLGATLGVMLASQASDSNMKRKAERYLTENPIPILPYIESENVFCTDVSGFGLLGHLSIVSREHSLNCTINVEKLPVVEGVFDLASSSNISASDKCNSRDFSEGVKFDKNVNCVYEKILYMGETNGPILIISERKDTSRIINNISKYSHSNIIGYCSKNDDCLIKVE